MGKMRKWEMEYERYSNSTELDDAIELITPIAIEKGLRFAIREGGRTVGSGVVSDIIA